jgi:hypothetical protein
MSDRCSQTFEDVLNAELDVVGDDVPAAGTDPIARAHAKQLVGLAFSGGGIRSATFNLGVLQGLAQMKLLDRFDYLSTVSGGGYIGAWLIAWIRRRSMKDVAQGLRPEWAMQPGQSEPDEIYFLRQFSNYLTPKLGWLGADMWTVIATYIRNLILNLTVLIAAMTLLLIFPRFLAILVRQVWGLGDNLWWWWWVWTLITGALVLFALTRIVRSLSFFGRKASDWRKWEQTHDEFEWREAAWIVRQGKIAVGDESANWKTAEGQSLIDLFSAAERETKTTAISLADPLENGDVFYAQEYQDFVLRAEFSAKANGRSGIAVWCPSQRAVDGNLIHVCGPSADSPVTGSIDNAEPVRAAALRPTTNDLEISCVKNRITVRINGETINSLRVAPKAGAGSDCFQRGSWKSGVVALRRTDDVQFHNLRVRSLPSSLASGGTQDQIQKWIVGPLFAAALLGVFLFRFGDVSPAGFNAGHAMRTMIDPNATTIIPWSFGRCALFAACLGGALVLLARVMALVWETFKSSSAGRARPARNWGALASDIARETISIAAASLLGGCGVRALYEAFLGRTLWEVIAWGPPALIGLTMLVLTTHIGLLGKDMPDELREWWSRLGAWLFIYTLGWGALFATAFYAAPFFNYLGDFFVKSLSVAWVASTLWGVYSARSAATGEAKASTLRDLVAQVTPYIFIVGLLLLLSWGIDLLLPIIAVGFGTQLPPTLSGGYLGRHWQLMDSANVWASLGTVMLGALLLSVIFSWRLDINQFSMHLLYRNRLGRCYLGASNRFRRAQPFTGFAADDDFNLWELKDLLEEEKPAQAGAPARKRMTAPYLIINAALNLVGGKELAWQQRKAASFVFTQQFCGYDFPELPPGYSPTPHYAASVSPVTLATAMAISGAAASPNMGYHTSPASAFLMTVFNVRLGWWLGNPRSDTWERSSPGNVLVSLLRELFGLTSDEGKYIYLSDGGHFENLGIYELVRRRCRFILACDAEEDRAFGFGGLGNAIEKCRADLGVDIEIDVEPIRRRNEQDHAEWHCAIGKIHYGAVDENQPAGILVYLKSSLTGDEPTDVLRYAAENAGFPHQSTGDQWFDESQFESYRALGCHIAQDVFGSVDAIEKLSLRSKEQLFVELAQRWHPPSAATKDSFTQLTGPVIAIYDKLRTNKNLLFLTEQIYPEWRVLFENTERAGARTPPDAVVQGDAKSLRSRLPKEPEDLQAGFYICNEVIQIMENAYVDLQLEEEYDHPDNRGWLNFFRHWSWAPMFRVTWAVSASGYGARFQSFCERHLELQLGGVEMDELTVATRDVQPPAKAQDVTLHLTGAIENWLGTELLLDAELRSRAAAEAAKTNPGPGERLSEEEALKMTREAIRTAVQPKIGKEVSPRDTQQKDPEWFAAATLLELIRRRADEKECGKWANDVADFIVLRNAIIGKRISTANVQKGLNAAERELLKLFFVYNPKLAATARIFRFYLVPGRETDFSRRQIEKDAKEKDPQELEFPFAFAILAEVKNEDCLVYFRVQDHLRRMGLGRRALQKMLWEHRRLVAKPHGMHPDAHEVPTAQDRLRFRRLVDSVKADLAQTRGSLG